jgi:xanthosine utilization system XapX-like protein
MPTTCPISNETVDERSARLCAFVVLIPLGLSLALASAWPALFLAVDFGLRGFGGRRWSPVARLARALTAQLGLSPRPTNGAPKAFAARLGFAFSVLVALAFLLGANTLGVVAGAPFALCAVMEGVFGFCVGCRIYQLWHRLLSRPDIADASYLSR